MDRLEEALAALRRQGCRITEQRKAVLQVVAAAEQPMRAVDIWQQVRIKEEDISLDTVYRNLTLLVEQGILLPIGALGKDATSYEWSHDGHHHHIRCVDCGQAVCLDICPVDARLEEEAQRKGYELLRHSLDLYGRCKNCTRKKAGQEDPV